MKRLSAILVGSILCAVCWPVAAHELALDANGCHQDGIYGKYHCHEGKHAGETFVSKDEYPQEENGGAALTVDRGEPFVGIMK